jgi:polyisoprenyl-phosphate glycosyltransferase
MKLSIIIPVYNGEKTIARLVEEVKRTLAGYESEIIMINDGSKDNSESVCENIALNNSGVIFISLRKNFGEHNAVMCGLNHITGDYAIIIDDDFQNPPSEILKLLRRLKKGLMWFIQNIPPRSIIYFVT